MNIYTKLHNEYKEIMQPKKEDTKDRLDVQDSKSSEFYKIRSGPPYTPMQQIEAFKEKPDLIKELGEEKKKEKSAKNNLLDQFSNFLDKYKITKSNEDTAQAED